MPDNEQPDNSYLMTVLEKSRTKLLDTTRRNQLISFRETAKNIAIIDKKPDQVYKHLVMNGDDFLFNPYEIAEDDEQPNELDRTLPTSTANHNNRDENHNDNILQTPHSLRELERKIRKLYYEHRSIIEETGANNLYLAVGFLEWCDNQDEARFSRSPLVLIPVHIEKHSGSSDIKYKLVFDDEALDTNYSLFEKLRNDFDIALPLLSEEEFPETYWNNVNNAISTRKRDRWNIIREMSLGLFKFSKQVMWHDLESKRWPAHSQILDKNLIKRILTGSEVEGAATGQLTEEHDQNNGTNTNEIEKLPIILDADSSQYSALIDAINLNDGLVIEGPPGTGKSQTISNLIAIALDRGLSVIFVAEKMAALNVVYNRLETAGLGDFCLQLHGLKTNKKELLSSLKGRIDLSIPEQGRLDQLEYDLELTKNNLIDYSKEISKLVGPEEIPLYDIPWRIEKLKQSLPDSFTGVEIQKTENVTFEQYHKIKNLFDDLGTVWDSIPGDTKNNWFGFMPESYNESHSEKLENLLDSTVETCTKVRDWLNTNEVDKYAPDTYEVERLVNLGGINVQEALPNLPSGTNLHFVYGIIDKELVSEFSDNLNDLNSYVEIVKEVNHVFDYASENSFFYADVLEKHSETLADICCSSDRLLSGLQNELDSIRSIMSSLDSLSEISEPIIKITEKIIRTIEDCKRLIKDAEKLSEGPPELSLHANDHHAKPTVNNYVNQAKEENAHLLDRARALSPFNIKSDIKTDVLENHSNIIRENQEAWFPIFKKDYRNAKKYIKRIMVTSSDFSRDELFLNDVENLLEYCKGRDSFKSNNDYKITLGTLFDGIDTEWDKLDGLITFSQKLRDEYGIDTALRIIRDWDSHVEAMQSTKDALQRSFSLITEYISTHPFPETLWQRPVNEISRTLKPWDEKLSNAVDDLIQPWCNTNITLSQSFSIAQKYKSALAKEKNLQQHERFDVLLKPCWEKSITNIDVLNNLNTWFEDRFNYECINYGILKFVIPSPTQFQSELFSELVGQAKTLRESVAIQKEVFSDLGEFAMDRWLGEDAHGIDAFIQKLIGAKNNIT